MVFHVTRHGQLAASRELQLVRLTDRLQRGVVADETNLIIGLVRTAKGAVFYRWFLFNTHSDSIFQLGKFVELLEKNFYFL